MGKVAVPASHDREWVRGEAAILAQELRDARQGTAAKYIERGLARADNGGPFDYLGHALHQLRHVRRVDQARLEALMAALGRCW